MALVDVNDFGLDEVDVHFYLGVLLLLSMVLAFLALASGTVAPYGRYAEVKSFDMSWGPAVPAKVAWVGQEAPSLVVPIYCLWRQGWTAPGAGNRALLALFLAHYVNRTIVYPLRIRGGKPTPLGVAASAFGFTTINGYLQGRALSAPWAAPVALDAPFAVGVAVFAAGAAGNCWHDGVLRRLRAARGGATAGGYGIPRGGLYEYVSGANFLCEIVEWVGFAIAARTFAAATFALCCALNVGPRAVHHHRWYLAKFDDYPRDRRALVPFVL